MFCALAGTVFVTPTYAVQVKWVPLNKAPLTQPARPVAPPPSPQPAIPSQVSPVVQSSWEVTQKRDPITDQLEVHARLHGDNADLTFMCGGSGRPVLVYEPQSFLGAFGGRYTQYDLRDMIWRFDGNSPQRDSWKYLNEYATPYDQKATIRFVTSMISSRHLVLRAERYDHATIDSTFDLTGAPQALNQAFTACGIPG
jgi:hypothetical protein